MLFTSSRWYVIPESEECISVKKDLQASHIESLYLSELGILGLKRCSFVLMVAGSHHMKISACFSSSFFLAARDSGKWIFSPQARGSVWC